MDFIIQLHSCGFNFLYNGFQLELEEIILEFVTVVEVTLYFGQCQIKRGCLWRKHKFQNFFEVEWDTRNKWRLFFTYNNDCGYFKAQYILHKWENNVDCILHYTVLISN